MQRADRQLRGLVLGWYNQRNAGDDRLRDCILQWLHDHELTFATHTRVPALDFVRDFDYVLLGGGSIANDYAGVFRDMQNWIRPAAVPVFCAGLGVSEQDQFGQEFRSVLDSGGRIWVRDQQGKINCRQPPGDVTVAPDLSWLQPMRFDLVRNGIALNLRPGGGPRVLDLDRWLPVLKQVPNLWPWPLCFGKDDDRVPLARVLDDAHDAAEFDPTGASRAELVIAMRFHAIIFAFQAGTPFVAITHTKKLQYLLEDLGLGYAMVPYDRPDLFPETMATVLAKMRSADLLEKSQQVALAAREFASAFKLDIETAVSQNQRQQTLPFRLRRKVRRSLNRWLC